jgi:capsular polysaccharide transport system permease protein
MTGPNEPIASRRREEPSFARSLQLQLSVWWALAMREALTRFGRHNVGFLWLFFEPMSFTIGITLVWTLLKMTHGSSIHMASFALTGYSSIMLWRNPATRISHSITVNMALLYHRNVRALDIVIARILLEIAAISASFFGLTIFFVFFEFCEPPEDIPLLVAGWSLLALFATGLSLCIAALTEKTELFDRVWHTITYLLFPFSGAGTLLDWLPPGARKALLYLPFAHGVEMIRHGYYGTSIRTHEDWQYLLYVSLVLVFVGIAAIESVAREVEPE